MSWLKPCSLSSRATRAEGGLGSRCQLFNTSQPSWVLTLPLFAPRVFLTDDIDCSSTLNNLAVGANLLNTRSDLHFSDLS